MFRIRQTRALLLCALTLIVVLPTGAARAADKPRIIESRHYRIHTDLDEAQAKLMATRMDAMYDEYDRRLAIFKSEQVPVLEAYLFRREQDYRRFTGSRNSSGLFMRELRLLTTYVEGQGRDEVRRTLQHEAFHQFAAATISPNLPSWLNEGMAQVFEEGLWIGNQFWLGQVPPHRVAELKDDIQQRRLFDFEKMLNLKQPDWMAILEGNKEQGAIEYHQSWAMVHFLIHAKDSHGKELYRGLLLNMLQEMHNGTDAEHAFEASFGTNIKGFEKRFLEWAARLQPTPEATLMENQRVLADLMILAKRAGKPPASISALRDTTSRLRFRVEYKNGDTAWRTLSDPSVYFTDVDGKTFTDNELYLEPNPQAPLPDLVCRMMRRGQLRTRFFTEAGTIQHERWIEPLHTAAGPANN